MNFWVRLNGKYNDGVEAQKTMLLRSEIPRIQAHKSIKCKSPISKLINLSEASAAANLLNQDGPRRSLRYLGYWGR